MPKPAFSAAEQKLLDGLCKPTKSARVRAERLVLEAMLDSGLWLEGADRFAAPLMEIAAGGEVGAGAAMRLLGNLIGEGDRAISTGPLPKDSDLARFDAPYAKALGEKRWRAVAAPLAKHVGAFERALAHDEAATRGAAAFLLAHIPEAKGALAKVTARAKVERDDDVLAALVFASGHLARYAGKEPLSAPAKAGAAVQACAALAQVVAHGRAPDAAGEAALVAGVLAAPLDLARFPWRDGALDKVTSTVCENRLGGPFAAGLLAKAIDRAPEDERSVHWAAATLALAFPERAEPVRAEELTTTQRTLLASLSVRDWKPLNAEFSVFGLPPHADDRRALITLAAEKKKTASSILEREIATPTGKAKVVDALRTLFDADATFDAFHTLLAAALSPAEHLEVAQLAAAQRLGLRHMGDAGAIAVAKKDPAACGPWAAAALAAPPGPSPRGDFWITLALFVTLATNPGNAVDPSLDPHIRADARIAEIAEPVLAALPVARREKVLARFAGPDPKGASLAFLPLAHTCPSAAVIKLVLDTTEPKALQKALGPGVASWTQTRVLPELQRVAQAASGAEKARLEKRIAELRALA